jgi:hypothetical protein
MSGTASGRSGAGINVFGADDSMERVDPSAQTNISGGSVRDQMALEGVGSGSGLLDLTRESDDTSLGAVLDEITPAGGRRGQQMESPEGSLGAVLDDTPVARVAAPPVVIQAADPLAPAFGGAALGAAAVLIFALFVLLSAVSGTRPDAVKWFETNHISALLGAAIGLGAVAVFFVIGLVVGKAARR